MPDFSGRKAAMAGGCAEGLYTYIHSDEDKIRYEIVYRCLTVANFQYYPYSGLQHYYHTDPGLAAGPSRPRESPSPRVPA